MKSFFSLKCLYSSCCGSKPHNDLQRNSSLCWSSSLWASPDWENVPFQVWVRISRWRDLPEVSMQALAHHRRNMTENHNKGKMTPKAQKKWYAHTEDTATRSQRSKGWAALQTIMGGKTAMSLWFLISAPRNVKEWISVYWINHQHCGIILKTNREKICQLLSL